MSVLTANSGMNWPLHSGQEPPQPRPELVVVTVTPITSTSSIPSVVMTERMRTNRREKIRSSVSRTVEALDVLDAGGVEGEDAGSDMARRPQFVIGGKMCISLRISDSGPGRNAE